LKILLFLLLLSAPCARASAAGWTPLKLHLYGAAAFPASDRVVGLGLNFAGHTDTVYGLQAGFYNSAGNLRGLQVGLVNVCKGALKGAQLGFANIGGKNAVLPVTIGLNIGF